MWRRGLAEYDEMEGIARSWQSVDGTMVKAPRPPWLGAKISHAFRFLDMGLAMCVYTTWDPVNNERNDTPLYRVR
jgi:hypothetical protein